MAEDLLDLIRTPAKAVAIGKNARTWMEQTQRLDQTLDRLAGYYRSAVGQD